MFRYVCHAVTDLDESDGETLMQGFRSLDTTNTLFIKKAGDIFHVDFESLVCRLKEPESLFSPTFRSISFRFPIPIDVREM